MFVVLSTYTYINSCTHSRPLVLLFSCQCVFSLPSTSYPIIIFEYVMHTLFSKLTHKHHPYRCVPGKASLNIFVYTSRHFVYIHTNNATYTLQILCPCYLFLTHVKPFTFILIHTNESERELQIRFHLFRSLLCSVSLPQQKKMWF